MPIWLSEPPSPDDTLPYRLIRVPAAATLAGIITCTDPVGCNTHYVQSRTVPCEGAEACPACAEGYPWRWHMYISLLVSSTYEHVLLELTAAASEPLRNYMIAHNSLRACKITARRPSARPNGRIVLTCQPLDETRLRLPEPPNIQRILCHLWGIPTPAGRQGTVTKPPVANLTVDSGPSDGRYLPPRLAPREPETPAKLVQNAPGPTEHKKDYPSVQQPGQGQPPQPSEP